MKKGYIDELGEAIGMKVGVFQAMPAAGDKAENLSTMRAVVRGAAALGTDIVVFSELFLTRYNIGDLCHDLAEPMDGPSIARVREIASEQACAIAVGYPERNGGQVYNSMAVVDKSGAIVGHYRKIQLFGDEEKRLFTPGDKVSVCTLNGCVLGLGICFDIEFPELGRRYAKARVDMMVVPTANMKPYWGVPTTLVRARALENGFVVAYANQCGEDDTHEYSGLSGIVGPDGKDIARAGIASETFLVSDIDFSARKGPGLMSTQAADLSPAINAT